MTRGPRNEDADGRVPVVVARKILLVLLLAMAGGQLSDVDGFVTILEEYSIGGTAVAAPLAVALIAGELVGGLGLAFGRERLGAIAALVTAVAWTVLGTQAFVRGLDLDNCGCFGVHLGQPLRWWVLVQDAEFVALAWWVRRGTIAVRTEPAGSVSVS